MGGRWSCISHSVYHLNRIHTASRTNPRYSRWMDHRHLFADDHCNRQFPHVSRTEGSPRVALFLLYTRVDRLMRRGCVRHYSMIVRDLAKLDCVEIRISWRNSLAARPTRPYARFDRSTLEYVEWEREYQMLAGKRHNRLRFSIFHLQMSTWDESPSVSPGKKLTQNNIQLIVENFQFVILRGFQWLQEMMTTVFHVTFDFIERSIDRLRYKSINTGCFLLLSERSTKPLPAFSILLSNRRISLFTSSRAWSKPLVAIEQKKNNHCRPFEWSVDMARMKCRFETYFSRLWKKESHSFVWWPVRMERPYAQQRFDVDHIIDKKSYRMSHRRVTLHCYVNHTWESRHAVGWPSNQVIDWPETKVEMR